MAPIASKLSNGRAMPLNAAIPTQLGRSFCRNTASGSRPMARTSGSRNSWPNATFDNGRNRCTRSDVSRATRQPYATRISQNAYRAHAWFTEFVDNHHRASPAELRLAAAAPDSAIRQRTSRLAGYCAGRAP